MKQSVVIKIGAFAPNIIIYTGNMGRLNKVKKKESKNVKIKRFRSWFHRGEFIRLDIQSIIMAVFTTLTIVTTIVMGMLIYNRFKISIFGFQGTNLTEFLSVIRNQNSVLISNHW